MASGILSGAMKNSFLLPAGAVAITAALLAGAAPTAQKTIEVGDDASYTFRDAPINSMGIKSLDEMRGKPVLVEFWGTK